MKSKRYVTAIKNAKKDTSVTSSVFTSIILLCDSPGYRMKSYGPSCLLQINNDKRLIDMQIESIKKHFTNFEIILCCGFDSDKVCKYIKSKYKTLNIRIVENQLFETSNSCESIRLALNNINNDKVVIFDGSVCFPAEIFSQYNFSLSAILIEKRENDGFEIGVNINERNIVEHFSFGAKHFWSEFCFLSNHDIIEGFRKIVSNPDYRNRFLFEALNELINTRFDLIAVVNKSKIQKINNIKTYHKIRNKK